MSKNITINQHNGHEFVEIGGIKWATCNVGAEKPTDAGLYFQWGDRKGYTADEVGKIKKFNRKHYKHHDGKRFTKYNELDGKQELDLRDDAAFAYMGQGWRMPTTNDFIRLIDNTTQRWTEDYHRSGVAGMVFTDRTDATKELFFPAAGYCTDGYVQSVGSYGYYWSGSLDPESTVYGCHLYLYGVCDVWYSCGNRSFGFPVRGILTA